jgi:F-type H+-transporting ATPase subunit a
MKRFPVISLLVFIIALGNSCYSSAQEEIINDSLAHKNESSSFDAGKFVLEHVSDAYEWHILTVGNTHVAVPLPVILYSKNTGFHVFLSSVFHHGHASYNGFSIAGEGPDQGKIIETSEPGEKIEKPLDLSITKSVAGVFISAFILLFFLIKSARIAKKNQGKAPTGLLNLVEPLVIFVRDEVAIPAIGKNKYEKYQPFLLSLFFFILINNLIGLIPLFPFGANVTGNISVTLVLALFTFVTTTFSGNKHYWKDVYNPAVPWWMKFPIPLMPVVEFVGLLSKPIILMVRLFANMMAGHLIITVFVSLIFIFGSIWGSLAGWLVSPISIVFAVFILVLDILVSFIQAYVFTILSALYIGLATAEHHA